MATLLIGSDLTQGVYHLGRQTNDRLPARVQDAVGKLQQDRTERLRHSAPTERVNP